MEAGAQSASGTPLRAATCTRIVTCLWHTGEGHTKHRMQGAVYDRTHFPHHMRTSPANARELMQEASAWKDKSGVGSGLPSTAQVVTIPAAPLA